MPWAPIITAQFVGPIIDNLIAVITRDETEALAWANGGPGLVGFAQKDRSRRADVRFPFLGVLANRSETPTDEEARLAKQRHEIVVEVALTGSDPNMLTQQLFKYVRAVDAMIRSASAADLLANLSADNAIVSWDVLEHNYTLIRQNANQQYLHIAQLRIFVEIWEQ